MALACGVGCAMALCAPALHAQDRPAIVWTNVGVSALADIDVSPDGTMLAVADDGGVKLFRAQDGAFIRTLRGFSTSARTVRFTPDGARVIGAGGTGGVSPLWGSLRGWSLPGGQPAGVAVMDSDFNFEHIRISHDAMHLVGSQSHSGDCACPSRFESFSLGTLLPSGRYDTFECGTSAIAVSPAEPVAVIACTSSVRLLNIPLGTQRGMFAESEVSALAYAPDGATIAVGDSSGGVRTRHVTDGALARTFDPRGASIRCAEFSPDGTTLAVGHGSMATLLDVDDGSELRTLPAPGVFVRAARFFPGDARLALGGTHGVNIFDSGTGELQSGVRGAHAGLIIGAAFSRDRRVMATAGSQIGDSVVVWDLPSLERRTTFLPDPGTPIAAMSLSPDGSRVAVTRFTEYGEFGAQVYRTSDGGLDRQLVLERPQYRVLTFSSDGSRLAAAGATSSSGFVRVWDTADWSVVRSVPSSQTYTCALSPDGSLLVESNGSGARVWNLADGSLVRTITPTGRHLRFSPDGATLAVRGTNSVRLINVKSGVLVRTLSMDGGGLGDVDFSGDGQLLTAGAASIGGLVSQDAVYLWRVADGVRLAKYQDEVVDPTAVSLSPAGVFLLYGRSDAAVVVARNPFAPCPPDYNEDGVLDSRDFFEFLDSFSAQHPLADYDADGRIDTQDFFEMLRGFFEGCN